MHFYVMVIQIEIGLLKFKTHRETHKGRFYIIIVHGGVYVPDLALH